MRLAALRLLAMTGLMNWPRKERVTTSSNPFCATRTRELSKRVRRSISYVGSFFLRAKGGERWPDVVTTPQGWDEKDERWKRATPILARPHVLRRSGRHWHCEVRDKRASGGAAKAKLVRTEMCWASCDGIGRARKAAVSSPSSDWQLRVVLQVWSEGQPSLQRSFANRVSGIRGLKSMHEYSLAVRVAGNPRRIAFLEHRNCSRCRRGPGGGKATKGTSVTGLGWPSSDTR